MGAWGYLAENNVIALDEQFHAEDAVAAEGVGDFLGDVLGLFKRFIGHGLGLPRFAVVALDLNVADGFAIGGAGD